MNFVKRCAKIAALTGLLSGLGVGTLMAAQDDPLPAPPGWVHTGWGYHTGKIKYPTIPLPPDVQGPEQHTNETLYLWVYFIKPKKKEPVGPLA